MSAVLLQKRDSGEVVRMPSNEQNDLGMQVAELRADVRHVQSDVSEIRAEVRATNQRIDELSRRTDKRFDRTDERFDEINRRMEAINRSIASAKIWALGLCLTLSGSLLYVLARGFKWI
jgi:uncharacterized protein YlxW (UPF0749 family)